MSAFNLIPLWLSAIVVFLTGAFLTRIMGVNCFLGWITAVILGAVTWWVYGFSLKKLGSSLQQRKGIKEKLEHGSRIYQSFAPDKNLPVGEGIYYECLTCGNVVPSFAKNARCKCQNIVVADGNQRPKVLNPEKVKIFSQK